MNVAGDMLKMGGDGVIIAPVCIVNGYVCGGGDAFMRWQVRVGRCGAG